MRTLARASLVALAACAGAHAPSGTSAVPGPGRPAASETPGEIASAAPPDGSSLAPLETRAAHGSLVFVGRAAPVANLAYQLDCLAGTTHCSQAAFHELWQSSWSASDDVALDAWRAVRRHYDATLKLARDRPDAAWTEVSYEARVRAASLVATSPEDYGRLLDVVLLPGDGPRLRAAFEHFWPRFVAWWTSVGRSIVAEPLSRMAALLTQERVATLLDEAERFCASALPQGTEVHFDLVARPASAGNSAANTDDNHLVIEAVAGQPVEGRIPVAAHELFHFFYAARSRSRQDRLSERFDSSPDPMAPVGDRLLNEVLATVLGNVLVGKVVDPDDTARRLARDEGLYADRDIDRTAKALAPMAETLFAGSIDDDAFVPAYLRAVHQALGDAPAPIEYLRGNIILVYSNAFEKSGDHLTDQAQSQGAFSHALDVADQRDELTKNPQFTLVALFSPRDMRDFDLYAKSLGPSALRAVHEEVKRGVPFAYAIPRPPHAMAFVLVANEGASMDRLVDAVVARREPIAGVLRVSDAAAP